MLFRQGGVAEEALQQKMFSLIVELRQDHMAMTPEKKHRIISIHPLCCCGGVKNNWDVWTGFCRVWGGLERGKAEFHPSPPDGSSAGLE